MSLAPLGDTGETSPGAPLSTTGLGFQSFERRALSPSEKALLAAAEPLCARLAVELGEKAVRSIQRRWRELTSETAEGPDADAQSDLFEVLQSGSLADFRREVARADVFHPNLVGAILLRQAWWERRIEGAYNAAAEVEVCGEVGRKLLCKDCGHTWIVPDVCDQPLLCKRCQCDGLKVRRGILKERIECAERFDPRGRRFLTLPVPHEGETADRVFWAVKARAEFFRRLGRLDRSGSWWATLEATEGDDQKGHLHWHAILVGPFLPDPLVCTLWGASLEHFGCPVGRRRFGEVLARLETIRCPISRPAAKALLDLVRVPWGYPGAPRRDFGESMPDYVRRRASAAPEGSRSRTVPQIAAGYEDGEAWATGPGLVDLLRDVGHVPHAVADIRISHAASDVDELCKYAIKVWDIDPELHARIWYELRRHGSRIFVSARGCGLKTVAKSPGCPKCSSPNVKVEPGIAEIPEAKLARLAEYLAGRPPAWIGNAA